MTRKGLLLIGDIQNTPNTYLRQVTKFQGYGICRFKVKGALKWFYMENTPSPSVYRVKKLLKEKPHFSIHLCSQVKLMDPRFPIWKPALGNDGPSRVRIQGSNANLVACWLNAIYLVTVECGKSCDTISFFKLYETFLNRRSARRGVTQCWELFIMTPCSPRDFKRQ